MRILYFSDVHLEVRERQAPSSWTGVLPLGFGPGLSAFIGRVDLLVLAGDIGRLRSTRNVSPLSYAQQAAAFLGCRVILVPGNHEYYRGSFDGDRAALLAAEIPGVTVLDRGEARPHRHDQRWADRHRQRERYAVGQANRARFSVGVRQPETSIDLGSRQRPIAVAQAGEQRDPGRETAGIWRNVGYSLFWTYSDLPGRRPGPMADMDTGFRWQDERRFFAAGYDGDEDGSARTCRGTLHGYGLSDFSAWSPQRMRRLHLLRPRTRNMMARIS
jgi:hypothetical protein